MLWSEFWGFLAYLSAVIAVLIVVVLMYGVFVLPEFKSLYGGLGVDLPVFTSALFGHGFPAVVLMLILVTTLLVFLYGFVFQLRRRLRHYSAMPAAYQRMPLVGAVALSYHRYLWLSYAGLLRAGSMPAAQALAVAGARLPLLDVGEWNAAAGGSSTRGGGPASGLIADLSIAARLGKLDEEAGFQEDASMDAFLTALARCRRRSRIILSMLIYLLVAAFVSAMYLPIFSLGSAI